MDSWIFLRKFYLKLVTMTIFRVKFLLFAVISKKITSSAKHPRHVFNLRFMVQFLGEDVA